MKLKSTLKKTAILGTLMVSLMSGAASAKLSDAVTAKWKDLTNLLDEATVLRDKRERLPEDAFFGSDKKSATAKIEKRLIEARVILLSAESLKKVDRANQIREKLPKLTQEVADYKNRKVGAPDKTYNPFTKTRKGLDKAIAEDKADIKRLNDELEQIQKDIAAELQSWGMKLTPEQTEVLFSSVVGDDLIRNAVIFENIKGVSEQLSSLMVSNAEDMGIARKYYGMYVTLIDVLLDTQNDFIDKIDKEWKPQVKAIGDAAMVSLKEGKAALNRKDFSQAQRAIFQSNVASNRLTVEAANRYTELLEKQRASVKKCIASISRDREVAENTYKTVQHISDMSTVIRSGLQLFDMLGAMQLPEIKPFNDAGARKEFDEITRRLQKF